MTGFSSAEREIEGWAFAWEVRSVNHRFLDVALRLPESFRFLEGEVRSRISQGVKRGRLDVILNQKKVSAGTAGLQFDAELVGKLLAAAAEIEVLGGRPLGNYTALDLLRWPGVLREADLDREETAPRLLDLLGEAMDKLVAVRASEGAQLAELIEIRCLKMRKHLSEVRARLPEVHASLRQKITARIAEVSAQPDPNRLEQELAYLAQKLDVAEELDRLNAHVAETLKTLRQNEPAGRRLDFLLQEMNREANTLGSKSADAETTKASVEMKVLIEQMREQIQNIE